MKLGVCYYPEQWPSERWPVDACLMRQAGLSIVRIADFAWSALEPREGIFDFEWLDRAIDVLAGEGLQIFLCTPTAAPPPWLAHAYPQILPVDSLGRRMRAGGRRHYCPTSLTYRAFSKRIVVEMASRYGHHPAVLAWQIDNELGWADTSHCYCDTCAEAFRGWLQARYGSIKALNKAWGTIFWGQTYGDWAEIHLPNLAVGGPNPGHRLDYERFSSDSIAAYQQVQVDALRAHILPAQKITTNFMSQFSELDYYDLARSLDFVSMSSYPTGQAEARSELYPPGCRPPAFAYDVGDPYVTSLWQTLVRGCHPRRTFWIAEQQCGHINWSKYNTGIRPGTTRLWTWHGLLSGAEAVIYFRWRAGLFGQEQLHSGLLHHDASPAAGFTDLQAMTPELASMAEAAAQPEEVPVALLLNYESLWALRAQPHRNGLDYLRLLFGYHRALMRLGLPADIISEEADLSGYRLVIVPAAYLASERLAQKLAAFVGSGGTVLVGLRSGMKDGANLVTDRPLPGALRGLVGAVVADWHALPPGIQYDLDSAIPGLASPAALWAEALTPEAPSARALARFRTGPFDGKAALVENSLGAGSAFYLGWYPDEPQTEALLAFLAERAGIHPLPRLPDGVIAFRRGGSVYLLNFTGDPQPLDVDGAPVTVGPRDIAIVPAQD